MTPWQVLRASRASNPALRSHLHPGPGISGYESTAAPDSGSIFSQSFQKMTLRHLNAKLAFYLKQVHELESANWLLECRIQQRLRKKSPEKHKKLEGHLRTASKLQDRVSESTAAQGRIKLQILALQLQTFDLNARCEKEKARRCRLEEELQNLQRLEVELRSKILPRLRRHLSCQTQHLADLQIQHQQDVHCLRVRASEAVTVEMQPIPHLSLKQHLDSQRKRADVVQWLNNQVHEYKEPPMTFDPTAEVVDLRGVLGGLEEELLRHQNQAALEEALAQDRAESVVLQLLDLQRVADALCRDLDSVLEAVARRFAENQMLADVNGTLEDEILDHRRLLDGLDQQWVSKINPASNCNSYSAAAVRKIVQRDETNNTDGEKVRKWIAQTVSKGFDQNDTFPCPISDGLSTVLPLGDENKTSVGMSTDSANATGMIHQFENEGVAASGWDSTVAGPICTVEKKSYPQDHNVLNNSTQKIGDVGKGCVASSSETEADAKAPCCARTDVALGFTLCGKNKEICGQEDERLEVEPTLHDGKQNSEDSEPGVSPCSPNSDEITRERHPTSTEMLLKEEFQLNDMDLVNCVQETNGPLVVPYDIYNKTDNKPEVEFIYARKSSSSPKLFVSLTDSGVALSTSDSEGFLSPTELDVFPSPTVPSTCLTFTQNESPPDTAKAEVSVTLTDHVFCPLGLEDDVRSPDSLMSPNDQELCLSAKRLEAFSPEEAKTCMSPDRKEDDNAWLMQTSVSVKPVEKSILLSKESRTSPSFDGEVTLSEDARNENVSISVKDENSEGFGSSEDDDTASNQMSTRNPECQNVEESREQPGLEGLCGKNGSSVCRSRDVIDILPIHTNSGSYVAEGMSSDVADSFKSISMRSSLTMNGDREAVATSLVPKRHGIVECMSYDGSNGYKSMGLPNKGSRGSSPEAKIPLTSSPETGRFGSKGSREWMVYGGLVGQKSVRSPQNYSEESSSKCTSPVTSQFGIRGRREWTVDGLKSASNHFSNKASKESPVLFLPKATSPLGSQKFGSGSSNELRVYEGKTEFSSNVYMPNAEKARRPELLGVQNFNNRGRTTGSTRCLSSASIDSSVPATISTTGSHMVVGRRPNSAGSAGRLSPHSGVIALGHSSGDRSGRLSCTGSGSKLCNSFGNASSTRFSSSCSDDWKPVYSSANGRRSSAESGVRPSRWGGTNVLGAPSPRRSSSLGGGSGSRMSGSTLGGNRTRNCSKFSSTGGGDGLRAGGRARRSSSSGGINSPGGRVITSNDRPGSSNGSRSGDNKERISVCKMAAISMSAAGRERSQERQTQQGTSPRLQQWLMGS